MELFWLGTPLIRVRGQATELETRKVTALLAYLSITGQPHTRASLAALFWPDYDPRRAMANLRRVLWSLNQSIEGAWLETGRDVIELKPGGQLWVDVPVFREAAALAASLPEEDPGQPAVDRLEEAAALYRGDLLAGFSLPDSPDFDDWQYLQTQQLRQDAALIFQRLAAIYAGRGALEQALEHARRWVSLDRLDENARSALMRLLARAGQRQAALRQYEDFTALLQAEMEAEPGPEIAALAGQIRQGAVAPSQAPAAGRAEAAPRVSAPVEKGRAIPGSGLPVQTTPFVGRKRELEDLTALLAQDEHSLITLVGPGGIGKTRLAIQVGEQARERFPDGVVFIPLAPLNSERSLLPALASILRVNLLDQADPLDQMIRYLAEKKVLLIWDNFEHLIGSAVLLVEFLLGAPSLKMLVTSRERLNLASETVFEVSGLGFPGEDQMELDQFSSYQLFVQSARRANPAYRPAEEEKAHIAHICRLVEGMPLAIELASSWAHILTAAEIAAELKQDIGALTSRLRDTDPGHRSLRAVFHHSWDLLPPAEQALFPRLSVFRSGFDRPAAVHAAGASLETLSGLVDRSFLRLNARRRFEIHELLRQYGEEKLRQDPAAEQETLRRHGEYYQELMARCEPLLKSPRQKEALDEIEANLENVRLAAVRALQHRDWEAVDRMLNSLYLFYSVQGWTVEGEALLNAALEICSPPDGDYEGLPPPRRLALARLLIRHGALLFNLYQINRALAQMTLARRLLDREEALEERTLMDYEIAYALIDEEEHRLVNAELDDIARRLSERGDLWTLSICYLALSILRDDVFNSHYAQEAARTAREVGNRQILVEALNLIGMAAQMRGDYLLARQRFLEGLEISREINYRWGISLSLDYTGYAARLIGDFDESRRLHEESMEISREIKDLLGVAGSYDNLGLVALDQGDVDQARELFERGFALREEVGNIFNLAVSHENLGFACLETGQLEQARDHFLWSLERSSKLNFHWGTARVTYGMCRLALAEGQAAAARVHLRRLLETLSGPNETLIPLSAPLLLAGLGETCLREGQPAAALRYLQAAQARHETAAGLRRLIERLAGQARDALPPDETVPPPPGAGTLQDWLDEVRLALAEAVE